MRTWYRRLKKEPEHHWSHLSKWTKMPRNHYVPTHPFVLLTSAYSSRIFSAMSGNCTTATITHWAYDISAFIKSIDRNHLVALGDEGFFNDPTSSLYPYQCVYPSDPFYATAGRFFFSEVLRVSTSQLTSRSRPWISALSMSVVVPFNRVLPVALKIRGARTLAIPRL